MKTIAAMLLSVVLGFAAGFFAADLCPAVHCLFAQCCKCCGCCKDCPCCEKCDCCKEGKCCGNCECCKEGNCCEGKCCK